MQAEILYDQRRRSIDEVRAELDFENGAGFKLSL